MEINDAREYRVGWFRSSHTPSHLVRCLFEGAAIAEAEKHHSFVRWCAPVVNENERNALVRARDGWAERAKELTEALAEVQADNDILRRCINSDTWIYQGDGGDNIESMGHNMVVAIHAGDLRKLLKNAASGTRES